MVNVMFGGNKNAFDGILISCTSMAKNTKRPVGIYVLTADFRNIKSSYVPLTREHIDCIDETVKKYNPQSFARLIDVTEIFNTKMSGTVNMMNHYTPYAFLRLFATYLILPQKMIYLDIDIMVRGDIGELYDIDVEDYELAAAKDYHGQIFIARDYFNSGVLLLNLNVIRETGLFDRTLELCRDKKMIMPDQSALNRFAKYVRYISPKFNRQRKAKPDTVIQHFVRKFVFLPFPHIVCIKPWEIDKVHKKYKIFEYDEILEEYRDTLRAFKENEGKLPERLVAATAEPDEGDAAAEPVFRTR